jgi:hypothetical protein
MAVSHGSHAPLFQDQMRRKIGALRRALLELHKALIEAERMTYERIHGRVDSTGQLLQLVLHDGWFTWLHPLSQLVVRIDEMLDDKEQDTIVDMDLLLAEIKILLRPSEQGDGFARSYYEALQRAPDVVLAHSQVKQLLTAASH